MKSLRKRKRERERKSELGSAELCQTVAGRNGPTAGQDSSKIQPTVQLVLTLDVRPLFGARSNSSNANPHRKYNVARAVVIARRDLIAARNYRF